MESLGRQLRLLGVILVWLVTLVAIGVAIGHLVS